MKSMEPESRTKFRIEQAHRDEAHRVALRKAQRTGAPGDVKNFYTGALGEMLAAAYLGVDWKDPGYVEYDLTDKYLTKYQVKATHNHSYYHHLQCEAKRKWEKKCDFERYIFVLLEPDNTHGSIVFEMEKEVAHLNAHDTNFSCTTTGAPIPGLWLRGREDQQGWLKAGNDELHEIYEKKKEEKRKRAAGSPWSRPGIAA